MIKVYCDGCRDECGPPFGAMRMRIEVEVEGEGKRHFHNTECLDWWVQARLQDEIAKENAPVIRDQDGRRVGAS